MIVKLVAAAVVVLTLSAHAQGIRTLDGRRVSVAEAEQFAAKTLDENHVTGAQIAILNDGKVVWSYARGLRRKSPDLPMTVETTTWAASITKAVFATYVMQQVQLGKFAFRPLLERLLGDTVTPWEWEMYTPSAIATGRANGN